MSVLVVMEQARGEWHRLSWETLAAGQQLGEAMTLPVSAAVVGHGLSELAAELARKRLERVFAVENELLVSYTADGFTLALESLVQQLSPQFVLFPHTYQVRDFAPKLATRFGRALLSDAVAWRINGGSPVFVRQLFQGKLNADVRPAGAGPVFVSLQAGAFSAAALQEGTAEVERIVAEIDPAAIRTRPADPFQESRRSVDLGAAEMIVAVGRGIKEKENLPVVEDLAQALGAELAASRPICDNGWLPMERQIGSSGQTVSPRLYLAVGISGAIQHLVGMKGARSIVAINKDPDAPIFEVADYGIVGDLFEVVPALTAEIKKARR
jgi:electron transfer flavoprotein alpha subunit